MCDGGCRFRCRVQISMAGGDFDVGFAFWARAAEDRRRRGGVGRCLVCQDVTRWGGALSPRGVESGGRVVGGRRQHEDAAVRSRPWLSRCKRARHSGDWLATIPASLRVCTCCSPVFSWCVTNVARVFFVRRLSHKLALVMWAKSRDAVGAGAVRACGVASGTAGGKASGMASCAEQ